MHWTSNGTNHVSRCTRSLVLRALTLGTSLHLSDLSEEPSSPEISRQSVSVTNTKTGLLHPGHGNTPGLHIPVWVLLPAHAEKHKERRVQEPHPQQGPHSTDGVLEAHGGLWGRGTHLLMLHSGSILRMVGSSV